MQHVSATKLARLVKCERQLYFDMVYGESSHLTQQFIKKGNREHKQFRQRITGKDGHWLVRLIRWLFRIMR